MLGYNWNNILHTSIHLEDAFGSVTHELIDLSLKRYGLPANVSSYMKNLYSRLNSSVVTKSWQSQQFLFRKGIFQGDPWSPIIFLIVFNPLLEQLTKEEKFGYDLNGKKVITTPFADDFNLITCHKTTHQRLINKIATWTKSMGLTLKPIKCRSLSLSSGKPNAIVFNLNNIPLDTLDNSPHKFLGSTVTFSGKQSEIFNVVHNHFQTRLESINELKIRNEYKMKMYKDYLLPASRFILTVHDLSQTNLDKIDNYINQYLKRWSGLPRSATPSVLHMDEFCAIKTVNEVYYEAHAVAYTSTRLKGDKLVNHALDSQLDRESQWSRKKSTIVQSSSTFESVTVDIEDPSDKLAQIKNLVKKSIHDKSQANHWNHISSLALQGEFVRIWDIQEADFTWKADINNLPRGVAKFLLNASLNTLPTKDNLRRWGKVISEACDLCRNRETLGHVLSGCPVALDQGRYTWRHDSVLDRVASFIKDSVSDGSEVHSDAGGRPWTVPPDILPTSDRPDLVVLNREKKTISIFELTVPYENNIAKNHQYKCHKYVPLILDLQRIDFNVKYFAVEIGCRGMISKDNTNRLHAFYSSVSNQKVKCKDFKALKSSLCKIAITASFIVYKAKFQPTWCSTPLIKNL